MTDLNLSLDYFDHPKTRRLIGLLGRGAEVLPIRLWAYCGRHFAKDGRLADHSPQEIETIVEWWGKTGEAVEAMVKVGFLECCENGYLAHDWSEHQGHIHALRERNKKVAKNRWKNMEKGQKHDFSVDTSGIPRGTPHCTSGVPQPTNQLTNQPTKEKEEAQPAHEVKESSVFKPPNPQEVSEYVRRSGYSVDSEAFCAYYEANGWRVGRSKMRDWKAAVRTWQFRDRNGGTRGGYSRADMPVVGAAAPVARKYASLGRLVGGDDVGRKEQGFRDGPENAIGLFGPDTEIID